MLCDFCHVVVFNVVPARVCLDLMLAEFSLRAAEDSWLCKCKCKYVCMYVCMCVYVCVCVLHVLCF